MVSWDKALDSVKDASSLKIRLRSRRGHAREAGGYAVWDEYQVIEGRKVIWRAETQDAADSFISEAKAKGGAS